MQCLVKDAKLCNDTTHLHQQRIPERGSTSQTALLPTPHQKLRWNLNFLGCRNSGGSSLEYCDFGDYNYYIFLLLRQHTKETV